MTHQVIPFNFQGADVRLLSIDGEPWFVAKDVAELLGYSDTKKAVAAHCKAGMSLSEGGRITPLVDLHPQTVLIPERDVYRLIMRSKMPQAEAFEDWVVGEVLPSIRKTGSYESRQHVTLPSYAEALRLYADQIEETQRVTAERDNAIATKALIGSRREATAMAKASAAARKIRKLEAELGFNAEHATVIAVERAAGRKFPRNTYVNLRRWCRLNDAQPVSVADPRYGSVKAWPAGAWLEHEGIDLKKLFSRESV